MKLYYSAGSCSTSCHITLEESGLPYEAIEVDWKKSNDPNVELVTRLNPLGTLPVMVLDDGRVLDQNASIHTYIAEKVPGKNLLPAAGTVERAQALNWLSFVAADLHKSFGPLFGVGTFSSRPESRAEFRDWAVKNVTANLEYLDQRLAGKKYLMGDTFTVADAYCFVVVGWTKWLEIPIEGYPHLTSYMAHVQARPAVQKVLREEGLLDE